MGEILFLLVLWTHWCNWFWYSIIQIQNTWVLPKDIGLDNSNEYSNQSTFEIYWLIYYYSIITLIGADIFPTNDTELFASALLVFIGSVLIGILIGQFTNVLLDLNSKETYQNEIYDMIDNTMFCLKLPLEIQNRIKEYYEMITESSYHYNKMSFSCLNSFYQDKIILQKSHETISQMPFMNTRSNEHLKAVIMNLEIESFQSGDIVLKQGTIVLWTLWIQYFDFFCFSI